MKETPYIDMHRVFDVMYDLGTNKDGVLKIDLTEPPHTQEGQIPCEDFAPEEIIDRYHEAVTNMAESQLHRKVEIRP